MALHHRWRSRPWCSVVTRRTHTLEHRFALLHPSVLMVFFASVIVLTLISYHPAVLGLSFVLAAASVIRYLGAKTAIQLLTWLLPMATIVVVFNLVFNRRGATELLTLRLAQQYYTFTVESLIFGLSIALMLLAIVLWFRFYQEFMTADRFLYLFAPLAPTVALSIAMVQRWIPLTKQRWQQIRTAQKTMPSYYFDAEQALSPLQTQYAAREQEDSATKTLPAISRFLPQKIKTRLKAYRALTRSLSALMSWSMEDAIQTADSMQARGYSGYSDNPGNTSPSPPKQQSKKAKLPRRTSFRSFRFAAQDRISLALIAALALTAGFGIFFSTRTLAFFPIYQRADELSLFALIAAVLLMLYPIALSLFCSLQSSLSQKFLFHKREEQARCLTAKSSAPRI